MVKKYYKFGKSIRGFSHKLTGIPRQDSCDAIFDDESGLYIIAIADGHGSEPLSQFGSKIAAEVACDKISDFFKNIKQNRAFQDSVAYITKENETKIYCGVGAKVKNPKVCSSKPYYLNNNEYEEVDSEDYSEAELVLNSLSNLESCIYSGWCEAVESCYQNICLTNKIDGVEDIDGPFMRFSADRASKKTGEVDKDVGSWLKSNNIANSDKEDFPYHVFGTTLVAVAVSEKFWFAIQVGDGKCLALWDKNEKYSLKNYPIPWDERCHQNVTTSVCDKDSLLEFRHCFGIKSPMAIFLNSDGIDDSFRNKDSDVDLYDFYSKTLFSAFRDLIDSEERDRWLETKLNELTENKSGDDVTVVGLIDNQLLVTNNRLGAMNYVRAIDSHFRIEDKPVNTVVERTCKETYQFLDNFSSDREKENIKPNNENFQTPSISSNCDIIQKNLYELITNFSRSQNNSIEEIKQLIRKSVNNINDFRFGKTSDSLLILAVRSCMPLEIINFILENGADVKAENTSQQSVLHCVGCETEPEIIKNLINWGAQVDCRNNLGQTPLFSIAFNPSKEVLDYFINCKNFSKQVDINIRDVSNRTVLSHIWERVIEADKSGDERRKNDLMDKFKILEKAGAKFSQSKNDSELFINAVTKQKSVDLVRRLLYLGCDPNATDNSGNSVIKIAYELNSDYGKEIVSLLKEYGAKISEFDISEQVTMLSKE